MWHASPHLWTLVFEFQTQPDCQYQRWGQPSMRRLLFREFWNEHADQLNSSTNVCSQISLSTFPSKVTRQWLDHLDWSPFSNSNYRSFNQPSFPCINTSISAIHLRPFYILRFSEPHTSLYFGLFTQKVFFFLARHRIWFYKYTAFNNIDWAVIHGQQNWEIPGS